MKRRHFIKSTSMLAGGAATLPALLRMRAAHGVPSAPGLSDQRLALPIMDPTQATFVVVTRLASAANANQTVFEAGPLRLMAQFSGQTGPCVRTGGFVFTSFELPSLLERWTCFIMQVDKATNRLRICYDGGAWVEAAISDWLGAPGPGYEPENYMFRNYYDGAALFGAPMNGAIHSARYIEDFDNLTRADLQALVNKSIENTAISWTVPELPVSGGGGGGGDEEVYLNEVSVTNASDLAAAIAAASPGTDIVLENGTYSDNFTLNASGTSSNPVRIRARNVGGTTIVGRLILNGEYNRAFGLRWNNYTTGSDSVIQVGSSAHFSKVQRCYLIDCGTGTGNVNAGVIQFLAPVQGAIAEYNRVKTAQGYSALKFTTTGNPAVATQNCVMRYNDLSDSANMIISHGGAGVRAGTDAFGGSVFEYNYASNARGSTGIGGQIKGSDITIRQNTFVNCGYMHSRHGYECNWISNTFDNTSGPILWGKGHLLIGNYISRSGSFGAAGPAPGSFVQDLGTALPGWTPGGGRYPRGEDIVCVGNVGPGVLSLNSTITASPTLNTKDTRLWQNSVSIDYGRNIGLDPLLPSYSTDPVSETIIPRIVLNSTLVGPTAAGAPNP